jgi:hypothetical protein
LEWGVKVGAHAVAVFGLPAIDDWKDRVQRRYVRRHADRPAVEPREETDDPTGEVDHLRRRVEHLETVVASADWNLLTDLESTGPTDERAATIADDVVSG